MSICHIMNTECCTIRSFTRSTRLVVNWLGKTALFAKKIPEDDTRSTWWLEGFGTLGVEKSSTEQSQSPSLAPTVCCRISLVSIDNNAQVEECWRVWETWQWRLSVTYALALNPFTLESTLSGIDLFICILTGMVHARHDAHAYSSSIL